MFSLPAFETKKIHGLDRFRGNGPYGKIPAEIEPIRALGVTLPYNKSLYCPRAHAITYTNMASKQVIW